MKFSPFFKRSLRVTRFHSDPAKDVDDEIQFHMDCRIDELVEDGWGREAAEQEVRRAFGREAEIREQCVRLTSEISRRRRFIESLSSVLGDIKLSLRDVRRHPGHFLGVSLTLALALTLVTAIFSVVYAVVLNPLPFAEPDRVVTVFSQNMKSGSERIGSSTRDYLDRGEGVTAFEDVALYTTISSSLGEPGSISREFSMEVTPSFFRVAGVPPLVGRYLDEDQVQPGREPQMVISAGLWKRLFASDPAVVGTAIDVEGEPHTIVGVMPESFSFPGWDAAVWLPLVVNEGAPPRRLYAPRFLMLARLSEGASVGQAQAEIAALNARLAAQLPPEVRVERERNAYRTHVAGFHKDLTRNVRGWLWLLLSGALLVLLVAGVSISNLQLVHIGGRLRELSTRFVLGAGRGRLVRQLLTESLVLATVGGGLGIVAGALSLRWWLDSFETWEIPRIDEVGLGSVEISVLLGVAASVMAVASLIGAMSVVRPDLFTLMRAGSSTDSGGHARWRGILVTAQISLAVVLLVAAALMVVSLRNLLAVDLGFEMASKEVAAVSLAQDRYAEASAKVAFFETFQSRVAALPGVEHVALTSRLPFSGWNDTTAMVAEGQTLAPGESPDSHHRTMVSHSYFTAMGIDVLDGRVFGSQDDGQSPRVAVVSEAMARHYWPGESAVGKRLALASAAGDEEAWLTVVGVVAEVVQEDVTESPAGAYYLSLRQVPRGFVRVIVDRGARSGESPWPQVLGTLTSLDPELALFWVTTLEESVASSLIAFRLPMLFLSIFAGIALLLAAVGVFGVLSRSVSLRSKEIGIRLALGSTRSQVCGFLLRNLSAFVGVGLLLGTLASLALSRWIESLIYGVEPNDPWVFLGVAALIAVFAILAAALPTLRASRVDPVKALSAQ
ncbi:MAG: ADOP family duplicated permease [Acidobacteriota bacterium]